MERVSKVAKALKHPIRVEMVNRLRTSGELTCTEVSEGFALTQESLNVHISVLRRAGIVTGRKDPARSPWRVYLTFNPAALEPLLELARPPA